MSTVINAQKTDIGISIPTMVKVLAFATGTSDWRMESVFLTVESTKDLPPEEDVTASLDLSDIAEKNA